MKARPNRHIIALAFLLAVGFGQALAEEPETAEDSDEIISGVPVVESSNLLTLDGKKISLWGVSPLAPDQQCWQNGTAWDCGEQATLVLRHFVESRTIECHVREKQGDNPIIAQCFRHGQTHGKRDIAKQLIQTGWALSGKANSLLAPPYLEEENKAHAEKSGIWGSHFQTAEDWEQGVQRFVGEDDKDPEK